MKTALKAAMAAFLLIAAVSVSAQPNNTKEKCESKTVQVGHKGRAGYDRMLLMMKDSLALTDAQVVKIKALDKATFEKMKVEGADKAAIMKEKMVEMKKIFTPEQYKKWTAMRKRMHDAHKAAKRAPKAE